MSKVKDLEKRILKARDAYYNSDNPIMSDKNFDALVDELKTLAPNSPAITMIGAEIRPSEWKKAKHSIPMGSLDKVNTPAELEKWVKNIENAGKLFGTEKLDGLSINCVYENGKLVEAVSRGSGHEGENIFVNVVKMQGVQPQLKDNFTGSMRGEIIMTKSAHQKYFSDKANPRNAASGVSKRLDGVGSEHLNVLFYQVLGDVDFLDEVSQFEWIKKQGASTPNYWLFKNYDEVNLHWRDYQDHDREKLDYEIDGLVIRVNDLDVQSALGDKDMRPKGAIAFKFDNIACETVINSIDWQVGNSGRVTPVAIFEPVDLAGVVVERASLYNLSYIKELELDVSATVLVVRANDVIPRLEELVKGTGTTAKPPKKCPECDETLEMIGENLTCINTISCPAQVVGRIKNWINELNLLEWGDALIERLVGSGKVVTVADLYRLSVDDLASMERMGQKSAQKCYDILWNNKEVPLDIFLGGLSIPMIGASSIRMVMSCGHDTLEKIMELDSEEFQTIPGLGPIKADSLNKGLYDNENLIFDILDAGVKIKGKVMGKLTGTKIAITGSTKTKRADLQKFISEHGGEYKSSVGKACTHLVIADINSTSAKAMSARKLGIKLIDEDNLLNLSL